MATERERPTYSRDQITKYFERLKIPEQERLYNVASETPDAALRYLTLLQKHHLVEIPFENLTLHYSTHHQISLHSGALFKKIIEDNNGRGGYCMENNYLFGTLLYSLGFDLYSGGARVLDGVTWSGFGHMINFVTIDDTKYHVDVGFGTEGPVVPMPLNHSGTIQPHMKPAASRVQWRNIPGNVDKNQRLWTYECRKNDDSDWEIRYCYTELEFLPQDYTVMVSSRDTTCSLYSLAKNSRYVEIISKYLSFLC